MKNIIFAFLVAVVAACQGNMPAEYEPIIMDIPSEPPVLPENATLDSEAFKISVNVEFRGDSVLVSSLPQGIQASHIGGHLQLRSSVEGVEYKLRGHSSDASFTLISEKSPQITLEGLNLSSPVRPALYAASPQMLYVNSATGTDNALADAAAPEGAVYKKASVLTLSGSAVLCGGGRLSVSSKSKNAIYSSGSVVLDGRSLSVPFAPLDGLSADSGIVIKSGAADISVARDALRSKAGNIFLLGGNVRLNSTGKKGDAVQAANILQYGGSVAAAVSGEASRGYNAKRSVYIFGGSLSVNTDGSPIYSEKKGDYTSGSCIKSEYNFYMSGGNVTLQNSADGGKGINCNGLLQIDGGSLRVRNHGNDVVHPQNYHAHTSAKGIKCDSAMLIRGGDIQILVFGRGERCEGLESKQAMRIGGDAQIYVYAYDDAVNAGDLLAVGGGKIYAYSVANDGVDCNGRLSVTGGLLIANGCGAPEQGIDVDAGSLFEIKGGELISIGGMMGPAPALPQGRNTLQPSVAFTGVGLSRGARLNIMDAGGNIICSYLLPRSLNDAGVLYSSPSLAVGKEYSYAVDTVATGDSYLGCGLYRGGKFDAPDATRWSQDKIIALVSGNGSVTFVEPDTADFKQGASAGGFLPPPFGNGGTPPDFANIPQGATPPAGGFPPPPFGNGGTPPDFTNVPQGAMPPAGGFPPPPFGNGGTPPDFANIPQGATPPAGGFPPPPPLPCVTDEGYDENNLPGGGW